MVYRLPSSPTVVKPACWIWRAVRVDDMEERQAGPCLDALAGGVDGVAGQEEEVRAGSLEITGLGGEQVPDQVPAALALVSLDLCEVGLCQHEPGTVQPAQAPGYQLVDGPAVDGRAGPCEAAHDPDGLHGILRTEAGHWSMRACPRQLTVGHWCANSPRTSREPAGQGSAITHGARS
jgi:hypothetical protein